MFSKTEIDFLKGIKNVNQNYERVLKHRILTKLDQLGETIRLVRNNPKTKSIIEKIIMENCTTTTDSSNNHLNENKPNSAFFSEKDWGVSVFDSCEKPLEAVKNRRYDICLVDLKMPEIDGLSFIKRLRNSHPTMPVVIMTAFPSVETAIDALRLNVDDYIIKPFNINKLFKTLDSLVEQRRKQAEAVEAEDLQL